MQRASRLIRNRRFRQVIVVIVVTLTVGLFVYYLSTHPKTLESVLSLGPVALILLTLAYVVTIIANALILKTSLSMIKKPVGFLENLSLTGYSSVVNFFGPLQSGPGFRAAYLKQKHGVSVKSFFYVTVLFYGFFALINATVLGIAIITRSPYGPLTTAGVVLLIVGGALVVSRLPRVKETVQKVKLNDKNFWFIGLGALLLSAATTAAYHIELTHVDPSIALTQTIVYAAAANLALFVSLTPGAIGFRESFLLLSQQLHGISSDTVIAASIIDRAFYVVFLLAVFVVLLAFGARARLNKSKSA